MRRSAERLNVPRRLSFALTTWGIGVRTTWIAFLLLMVFASAARAQELPAAQQLAAGYPGDAIVGIDGNHVLVLWKENPLHSTATWLVRRSSDGGRTFSEQTAINLASDNGTDSASDGRRLHLCWVNYPDAIQHAYLDIHTGAISVAHQIQNSGSRVTFCRVSARAGRVAVLWRDESASAALVAHDLAVSVDGGDTFSKDIEIGWAFRSYADARFSADGKLLHVVWGNEDLKETGTWYARVDPRTLTVQKQQILPKPGTLPTIEATHNLVVVNSLASLAVSIDGGVTFRAVAEPSKKRPFTDPLSEAKNPEARRESLPTVRVSLNNSSIYFVARDRDGNLYFSASHDAGLTLSEPQNLTGLSYPGSSVFGATILHVGQKLVVAWSETVQGEWLAFRVSEDDGRTFQPLRKAPYKTRLFNRYAGFDVYAVGDALLFIWSELNDSTRKLEGRIMYMRVVP